MIGPWEIFMILVVVLLLFGAGRLPSVMGDVAKGVKAFKSGLKDEDAAQSKSEKSPDEPVRRLTQNTPASSSPTENAQTDEHRF